MLYRRMTYCSVCDVELIGKKLPICSVCADKARSR